MKKYVISAFRHTGTGHYAVTLLGPNNSGYTPNLDDAGVYDESLVERFKSHLNNLCTAANISLTVLEEV